MADLFGKNKNLGLKLDAIFVFSNGATGYLHQCLVSLGLLQTRYFHFGCANY